MKVNIICGLGLVLLSNPLLAQQTSNTNKPTSEIAEVKASEPSTSPPTEVTTELLGQQTQPPEEATSIKVIVQKKQTIEEYRQRGELVLVKVIPNDGAPYFIDPLERENLNGSGKDIINSGVKPVRWVLKEF